MLRGWLPTIALAMLSGCVATPLPDPPDLDGPELQLLTADPISGLVLPEVIVAGRPGAAEAGATLRIYPLDQASRPVDTVVAADGSFQSTIAASPGEELRLSLFAGERRAAPLDVVVPRTRATPDLAARSACLVIEPERELPAAPIGQPTAASIVVVNRCAGTVTATARPRATFAGLTIDPSAALEIAAGGEAAIELSYVASESGPAEEVVLIAVGGAVDERRAVTVRARGL